MTDQHATDALDDLFLDDDDAPHGPAKRTTSSRRWRIGAAIAGIAAVAAVGFALGRATAGSGGGAATGPPEGFALPAADDGTADTPPGPGGFGGGGFVSGELAAIDGDEWLVTDSSGNTIRVKVSDSTTYRKTESVTAEDVAIGEQVTVIGEEQDDGSVDAATVQSGDGGGFAGPPGGFGGGGPGAGADPTEGDTSETSTP